MNQTAIGFKPIACGDRNDAEQLAAASTPTPTSIEAINPVFLKTPVAPIAASAIEGRKIEVQKIRSAYQKLTKSYENVIIEGTGGWAVPINTDYSMEDLAAEFGTPVLIVVDNKLGALNQTILTANAIRDKGLKLLGVILNHVTDERDAASITNRAILKQTIDPPIIVDLLHGETEIEWPF